MKKTIALLALAASSAAYAQLTSLPPTIAPTADAYGNTALWNAQINALTTDADNYVPINPLLAADGILSGGVAPIIDPSNFTGIRVIFLGETAGWLNDFGFTLAAPTNVNVAGSTSSTFAPGVAATAGTDVDNATMADFTFWDFFLTPAAFSNFDIWFNTGSETAGTVAPTTQGGLYSAFHPSWDNPNENPGFPKAAWSQGFTLQTNTATGTVNATTYILSFEDLRKEHPLQDKDYSDLILAVQILGKDGTPNGGVPEPTTYGVIGAAALLGLITIRRRLQK